MKTMLGLSARDYDTLQQATNSKYKRRQK